MSFYVRYASVAACGVVVLVVAEALLVGGFSPDTRSTYAMTVRIACYAAAALTAAFAAAQFGWWREHIGRSWTLFMLMFVLLIANYVLRRTAPGATAAIAVTLIAANVAEVAALWLMARVINAAGIGQLLSTSSRILITVAALAVALILCHAPLVEQWHSIRAGNAAAGQLFSTLADVITFTLLAPLAMNALALRGGQLSWTFAFLTISLFGWMINTGAGSIASYLGGDDALRTTRVAGLVIASLFVAAAAATQRHAAQSAMRTFVRG